MSKSFRYFLATVITGIVVLCFLYVLFGERVTLGLLIAVGFVLALAMSVVTTLSLMGLWFLADWCLVGGDERAQIHGTLASIRRFFAKDAAPSSKEE